MSRPDKPDAARPRKAPRAGDQPARRQDEHRGRPPSVQPEEPSVVAPRPQEPTVVAPRRQEFIYPRYSSSQQPGRSAYPPQHQPGPPQPPVVEYSHGPAAGQQYGTQPVYGQPPFGPQQGRFNQPRRYGHVENRPEGASSRLPTAVLSGGIALLVVVIVAVVLALGSWRPSSFFTTKLDVNDAQIGVQQVLTDQIHGYGAKNVEEITCNDGQNPTVKKGGTFTCEARINGAKRQVTVTFQDDKGNYEVGRPS